MTGKKKKQKKKNNQLGTDGTGKEKERTVEKRGDRSIPSSAYANAFYNPSDEAGYGGAAGLAKSVGGTVEKAREWLSGEDSYSLFKQARKKLQTDQIFVQGVGIQYAADLIDLPSLVDENSGHRYILTVIDSFSRFAHATPLKDKRPGTTARAMTKIFASSAVPESLRTDKGSEFLGKPFADLLRRKKVRHYFALNSTKEGHIERFNRTLKQRLFKLLHARGSGRYLDVLPDLLLSYNNRKHRSIGMAPKEVTVYNQGAVWQRLYGDLASKSYRARAKPRFKISDTVRLTRIKSFFQKGYDKGWTAETFKIDSIVQSRTGAHRYKVRDLEDELIEGSFLSEELQRVRVRPKLIRKTLRRQGDKKQVQFRGYPDQLKTWLT